MLALTGFERGERVGKHLFFGAREVNQGMSPQPMRQRGMQVNHIDPDPPAILLGAELPQSEYAHGIEAGHLVGINDDRKCPGVESNMAPHRGHRRAVEEFRKMADHGYGRSMHDTMMGLTRHNRVVAGYRNGQADSDGNRQVIVVPWPRVLVALTLPP